MSAVLQKSNRGSYQRVLYGRKAPEAQISTVDGITTLVSGDTVSGTATGAVGGTKGRACAQEGPSHLQGRPANGFAKAGKEGRKKGAGDFQSHGNRAKGVAASSGKAPSHLQKPQSFSGLGRVL